MLGIEKIATFIPDTTISNYDLKEKFDVDDNFLQNKIGVESRSLKNQNMKASDMCVKAFEILKTKIDINISQIECCVVVTQNPDFNLPHTSAIVHGKLSLKEECAAFDISLGCSGFVYGLSNIISFMKNNHMKKGLLFTSDQYSSIIDEDDKNTALLFGDASTVTLIGEESIFTPLDFSFGTKGSHYEELLCDNKLFMNGRSVFSFTATTAPKHIKNLLAKNNLSDDDINRYFLHQGSKYIVDTITKRLKVDKNKVPFDLKDYGNTVSSTIPIMLDKYQENKELGYIILSAFGVGLSWASAIITKIK
jgi:3-oxoacyl-[acyl-carrier-protein] synthase-3